MEGLQEWRVEGGFGGACKMKVCIEALVELGFCTKPPNFGVESCSKSAVFVDSGVVLLHVPLLHAASGGDT
jgi:hypothetical protein